MSFRFDSSLIPGAYHLGNRALGVLAALVPASGESGPGYVYNDLTLPDDANKEVRGYIESTTLPGGTLTAYEDTSFSIVGAPDGTYTITYRLYVDGVDMGTANATINIGDVVSCAFTLTTDAGIFSGSASSVGGGGSSACSITITTDNALVSGSAHGAAVLEALPGYTCVEKPWRANKPKAFDPKDPDEIIVVAFDFRLIAAAVQDPLLRITRYSGAADANPEAIAADAPQVVGAKVCQRVTSGVDACTYHIECQVDTVDGARYVLAALLPVRSA